MRRAALLGLTALLAAPLLAQSAERSAQSANPPSGLPVREQQTRCALRSALCAHADAADTSTQSFSVGGLNVILRRVTANDVVAANLYLLGGTRLVGFAQAGIEPFLLHASERGTAGYPREMLRRRMAELGTQMGPAPDQDWTTFALRATGETFDSTWAIFADRLMRPTLDSADVELVRSQLLNGVRQRRDDPDALLEYLADSVAYAGHPYGIEPSGTETSLARITLADLKKFQRERMVTSRMLLVIVGNVTRPQVERLVSATLARLPKGDYSWSPPPPPAAFTPALVTETRQLPTNYILGYYAGPPATGRDYHALRIATAVLTGRLFSEIRAKRNLTYAVDAPFIDRAQTAGGLYVTTVDPNTTLRVMKQQIAELQNGWITPRGLDQVVQQFITEYFLKNETNADQANQLARAQLYQGDWRHAVEFADELRQVTPDDIHRVLRTYIKNVRFVYVGDPTKLDRAVLAGF